MAICFSEVMTFGEKLEKSIGAGRRVASQVVLARQTGIPQTTISALVRGVQKASLEQAFKLAQALGLSLDYLADDTLEEPPVPELSEEERHILRVYRSLRRKGVSLEEVEDRLIDVAGEPGGKVRDPAAQPKMIGERDESEMAKRQKEERRKLGFELEANGGGAGDEGDPSVRRRR